MKTVKIKTIEIGKGVPKLCVPLVGRSEAQIYEEIVGLESVPFDIAEWRADYYGESLDINSIVSMLDEISNQLAKKVVLFTFRSGREGGAKSISGQEYLELYERVILSKKADMVDIELFSGNDTVKRLIYQANNNDVCVLASNHDFEKTPNKEVIIKRLCVMQDIGADIAKIAVMPKTIKDVAVIIDSMAEMVECYADKPFTAISMSRLGFVSRIIGEVFGSCITYGALNSASAPGQIDARELDTILKTLHKNV